MFYFITGIITILYPILGLFINIGIILFSKERNYTELKFILFLILICFSIISFLYVRTNETGDIYQYSLMFDKINEDNYLDSEYNIYYYSWNSLLFSIKKITNDFRYVTAICIFLYYYFSFSALFYIYKRIGDYRVFKLIFFKIITMVSIISIVSSYRNPLAFVITLIAILFFIQNKYIRGLLFSIIGVGLHPSAGVILIAFFISKLISAKRRYLMLSLLVSIVILYIDTILNNISNSFVLGKINAYILGEWSNYKFESLIEYIVFYGVYSFITLFLLIVMGNFLDKNLDKINEISKIKNFILIYFVISLPFFYLKTISDRLLFSAGGIILILFCYFVFYSRKIYKPRITSVFVLLLWFSYVDPQLLYFAQKSYYIGEGFPYNIFFSPIFNILK